jgi:hypothetical protein
VRVLQPACATGQNVAATAGHETVRACGMANRRRRAETTRPLAIGER